MEGILIPLGLFTLVAVIVWLRGRVTQVRLIRQADTKRHLLDRFQSGQELAAFIDTEGGQRFLREFETNPDAIVLGFLSTGIVSVFLGLAFLGLMVRESDLLFPGVLLLSLGTGLMVAAGVSRRLSRRWRAES